MLFSSAAYLGCHPLFALLERVAVTTAYLGCSLAGVHPVHYEIYSIFSSFEYSRLVVQFGHLAQLK